MKTLFDKLTDISKKQDELVDNALDAIKNYMIDNHINNIHICTDNDVRANDIYLIDDDGKKILMVTSSFSDELFVPNTSTEWMSVIDAIIYDFHDILRIGEEYEEWD